MEDCIRCRLGEDICELILSWAVADVNEAILVVLGADLGPEMMVFDGDVLRPGREFWVLGHGNARLIVLVDFQNKLGLWDIHWKDSADLPHEIVDWYCLPQSLGHRNALRPCRRQRNLCLEFALPVDWEICILDDKTCAGVHQRWI